MVTKIKADALDVNTIDWTSAKTSLDERGFAVIDQCFSEAICESLIAHYDNEAVFRKVVNMGRHQFGKGEYKYFAKPLPDLVQRLRESLYPPLAQVANSWSVKWGDSVQWPRNYSDFLAQCESHGQVKSTALMLRYQAGDYNRLHQDIYGEVYFPFQAIFLLSEPEKDFTGGSLTLVENYPRMQSRPHGPVLKKGSAVIIATKERPIAGARGWRRAKMRHGVTEVLQGERFTLGIIFHDA